ncbi:MAG TPA: PfkB family carbohydrate kinase [Phycicoccus sp.]|nr:PfkB family carbohydrate kinase [Phycicoccus sp.]HQH06714.1 PfkB family carbohydrate kinase [Phycicoccus sp.]HQK32548.1 PfkB family carbohydrate kinase [Phycicoccus sp.]
MAEVHRARPRVIHTAQALVDEVAEIPELPRRGQNAMATSFTRYAASAVNILLAAARSGATCVHAGTVGTGHNADLIRETLAAESVAISSQPLPDQDTGICFVMIEPSAERTFVTTLGAERHITVESLATSAPTAGDVVCVSGYSLVGATRDPLLSWLESLPAGVVVVLDPGAIFAGLPAPIRERVLALTTVWTSNAEEATGLTGWTGLEDTALALSTRLPSGSVVVVRDGPKGCVVREGGSTAYVAGFPRDPVDTNGAGDCHTGVMVAGHVAGLSWTDAARRANAGAAIKVTRRGPNSAPTAAEVDALLADEDQATGADQVG